MSNPISQGGSDAANAASPIGRGGAGAASAVAGAIPSVSHNMALWAVLGAGLVLVIAADFAPRAVNGLLVLILAGVILRRSDVWVPWLQGIQKGLGG